MEYELKDAGPCQKTLSLKFSADDIDAAFTESYEEINNHVQIKGFRKGKAPRRTLEKRFAAEAASGVRDVLLEKNLTETIKNENLLIIGSVINTNTKDVPAPKQPFALEFKLDVAPDIELPQYEGLDIQAKPVEVSDAEVDKALERYRKMFANYKPVDGPAEPGDVLDVDFIAAVDGQELMNMKDQRLRVEGDILFGLPCPELQEKFVGAKAGDKIDLIVTLPDDHQDETLRGKAVQVEVSVKGVERGELAELNDAFAAGLGMNTLAEFRDRIKSNLIREAMLESRTKQEEEIIDKLLAETAFEIPGHLVKPEADALLEQRRQRLQRTGSREPGLSALVEQFRPEAEKLAERKVRWGVLATKIGEKEDIKVTNEDLAAQVEALASSYNTTPAKIIQRIREFDGVGPMAAEILSIKVIQCIIDNVKGGKNDPETKNAASDAVNTDAAESVAHGDACGCGEHHHH